MPGPMTEYPSTPNPGARRSPEAPRRRRRWLAVAFVVVGALAAATWRSSDEYVVEVGPFSLPAHSGHHGVDQPAPLAVALPFNGWVHGLGYQLVDANGKELPDEMLHHLNLIAPAHRELFSGIMLRIGAAGPETRPYSVPSFIGYRVQAGDTILIKAMLHNPTGVSYQGVRLRVRLPVTKGATWVRPLSVQPLYLDVMPPAGTHAFDLPPGHFTKSWEGKPAIAARLLAAEGHMHQYGTALRLEDVTTGDLIWEARPRLDDQHRVLSMPTRYFLPFGVKLHPDHTYRLTAEYDNPTDKVLVDGGMGALGGVVLPASGTAWPLVMRNDSVYQHDVRVVSDQEPMEHEMNDGSMHMEH
jgi:hypothetical protein